MTRCGSHAGGAPGHRPHARGAAQAELLRTLGCDVVINYKKEDVRAALRRECPNGCVSGLGWMNGPD